MKPFKRHTCFAALSAAICVLLFCMPAMAAMDAYITIKGSKQGTFKGESSRKGHSDEIKITSIVKDVSAPRDAHTGLSTGKREHNPIIITKQIGAASPQFLQALNTKELLKEVDIEFEPVKSKADVVERITLNDAVVASVRKVSKELEEITFTYQKITVVYTSGKTTATDDWETP